MVYKSAFDFMIDPFEVKLKAMEHGLTASVYSDVIVLLSDFGSKKATDYITPCMVKSVEDINSLIPRISRKLTKIVYYS